VDVIGLPVQIVPGLRLEKLAEDQNRGSQEPVIGNSKEDGKQFLIPKQFNRKLPFLF
jgi:hypothetical protein